MSRGEMKRPAVGPATEAGERTEEGEETERPSSAGSHTFGNLEPSAMDPKIGPTRKELERWRGEMGDG